MTDLDLTLTPAQWEHWDRHGWTLTTAPTTECRNSLHDGRSAPVSEYHCPECGRAPYRSKDGDWYCFDPKGESTCRWRGPNPLVTPCCSPVPATVPCPECGGTKMGYTITTEGYSYFTCPVCSGSGVVPRVVGIIPPEWCGDSGPFPAERVGIATVTPVPVVDDIDDSPEEAAVLDVSTVLGVCWFWPEGAVNNGEESDVTALFATPPAPGGTVWRLDKENDHE